MLEMLLCVEARKSLGYEAVQKSMWDSGLVEIAGSECLMVDAMANLSRVNSSGVHSSEQRADLIQGRADKQV